MSEASRWRTSVRQALREADAEEQASHVAIGRDGYTRVSNRLSLGRLNAHERETLVNRTAARAIRVRAATGDRQPKESRFHRRACLLKTLTARPRPLASQVSGSPQLLRGERTS
jgi:hypothetical protein